jgi:hypothetical protein
VGRVPLAWFVAVTAAVLVACGAPSPGSGADGSIGGITVTPTTATVAVDESVQLTATLTGVIGNPNRGINWTSSDTSRATVSSTGLVTGKVPGAVAIAASSVADPTKADFATVTVTGVGGADTEVMLIPNFTNSRIEILRVGGPFNQLLLSTPLNTVPFPTAVAVGPDGRVYVASVSANPNQDPDDPFDDGGIVIYPPAALNGGTVAPIAVLTSPLLGNPFALTFDANGTLWVGNTWQDPDPRNPFPEDAFRFVALLGFRDVVSITANADRDPDVVLATLQGDTAQGFYVGWGNQIESMHLDGAGHLWVTDGGTVTRIDDLADVADGTVLDLEPGAQIQTQFAAVTDPDDNNVISPRSAVVDAGGRLYVGNGGSKAVSRFSDAADLTGVVLTQPDGRFFVDGVPAPFLMTINAGGELWFGAGVNDTLRLVGSPHLVNNRFFAVPREIADYPPGFSTYATGGLTMTFAP